MFYCGSNQSIPTITLHYPRGIIFKFAWLESPFISTIHFFTISFACLFVLMASFLTMVTMPNNATPNQFSCNIDVANPEVNQNRTSLVPNLTLGLDHCILMFYFLVLHCCVNLRCKSYFSHCDIFLQIFDHFSTSLGNILPWEIFIIISCT